MKTLLTCLLLVVLLLGLPAAAQNSCADPFGSTPPRFDPALWPLTDFCQTAAGLDWSTIRNGGVPPDGIPAIDFPRFDTVTAAADWWQPQSPVIAVVIDGQARAYPLGILIWHEIVNDTLADVPIAVTFCPLCNTSLVFDRRVALDPAADPAVLSFGVSGNLRNSDLIMYDRETGGWWQQFTGEGLVGSAAGHTLTLIASQVVSFGDFSARYPDGDVLAVETGFDRQYGVNPYANYERTDPFLFEGTIDPRLPAMEHVLAGLLGPDAEPVAYPFAALREQRVINDAVGGLPIAAFWQPGMTSPIDEPNMTRSRELGSAAVFSRQVGDRVLTFSAADDGTITDAETGSAWNIWGEAVSGELAGERLELQFAAPHLWFAWAAFRPATRVYGLE